MANSEDDLCGGADFCLELSDKRDVTFDWVYGGNPPSRRVLTTELFALVVDLCPLTVGHLLLLPKHHYLSFAQVARHHGSQLRSLLDTVLPLYHETFGMPVILEHGSTESDNHNACITHAHWHILPANAGAIEDQIRRDGLIATTLLDISTLAREPWLGTAYHLTYAGDQLNVYPPLPAMPRQYIRSVIGRCLGMRDPQWDYAVFARNQLLRDTLARTATWPDSNDGYLA